MKIGILKLSIKWTSSSPLENTKIEFLYDVIPMEACHILLGRPWKINRKTSHNGHTNETTLLHNAKNFFLHPLTLIQFIEDQAQMRARRDEDKSNNSI